MRPLAFVATVLFTALFAGCGSENARDPLPFEGVDISGIHDLSSNPDWSDIQSVGMDGVGYPSVPLLPLEEVFRIELDPFTEESKSGFVTAGFSAEGELFLGMENADLYLLSSEGARLRRVEAASLSPILQNQVGQIFHASPREVAPHLAKDTLISGYNPVLYDVGSGTFDAFYAGTLILRRTIDNGGIFVESRTPDRDGVYRHNGHRIYWIPASPERENRLIAEVRTSGRNCASASNCLSTFRAPRGRFALDAHGRVYTHAGLPYQINVYDHSGNPVRRIARPHTPTPTLDAMHELLAVRSEVELARIERISDRIPEHLGALGTLLVSHEGTILVNRPDLTGEGGFSEDRGNAIESSYWDLFSPIGDFIGTIETPDAVLPLAISDRDLLVIETRQGRFAEELIVLSWEP